MAYRYKAPEHTFKKPAPEIGAVELNSTPDSGASFSCRRTTSNVIDCLRVPKTVMTLEVVHRHEKTGAGIWRRIYGDGFWSVSQGHKVCSAQIVLLYH